VTVRSIAALALLVLLAGARAGAQDAAGGETQSLAHLEQRSRAFYDLLERGERERAAAVWPALEADLDRLGDSLESRLDRMRDDVVERDGDLEELYRSSRWRDLEIQSLVVTYHLAWVRYQAAQLTGDAKRKKALLQGAVEGFSRFLLVNEVPEIYAESLYGRGLAFLDLGDYPKATEDLTAAVEQPKVAAKARAALDETKRRAAGKRGPAADDPEALLARLGELLPRAAGGDAPTEKEATTLARGLAARGGPWPARVQSVVTERLGGEGGVRSSYGNALLAQLAVDRGRCADVATFTRASAEAKDGGSSRFRPEILFLDAGCKLNSGNPRDAAEGFASLLHEFPDSPRAREAAYYRFRALDLVRAEDPSVAGAYEEALTAYLARFGGAEGADEARYQLAELHRARGDCDRAEREYGQVTGGAFATRARLGAIECRVGRLDAAPATRPEVLRALRDFVRTAPKGADPALLARAALLGGLVAAGATPPDNAAVVELLGGFETRYPDAKALHSRALDLRLNARVALGDLDGAGRDLDAVLARQGQAGDPQARRTLERLGRDLATQAERAKPPQRDTALALARRIYGALAQQSGDPRDQIVLADLELRAGDAAGARRLYEAVLARDQDSAEALRGAARAAAAAGDRGAALGYWRQIVETSPTGGTAWYEARLAQVTLLAEDGHRPEACEVLRLSRGRATSAGADQLEVRLRGMEGDVCR
jgi:tetratricopeptide (TPR) repeat protein